MSDAATTEAIALGPELTITHADAVRQLLLDALAAAGSDGPAPALSLSGVASCDTAGVQLLLAWRASLAERGWPLRLAGTSPALDDVLTLYGLSPLLPHAPEDK